MKLPRISSAFGISSNPVKALTVVSHHSEYSVAETTGGLSLLFTILCIIDLFGVFPIVALPKSVIACGIYGIPLVLSVFGLQLYTAALLGKSWLLARELAPGVRDKNRFPYGAVAELAFGSRTRALVTFLQDATIFGAGIPNFIFAAQSMQLFWWKITGGEVGVSYCVWMVLIGLMLCPVMWLGSPKDMKPLALASVCIVGFVAVCTWTSIITDDVTPPSTGGVLSYQPTIKDFLVAYGIIAFQFDIHPSLLTIQVDMKDSRGINKATLFGFAISGAMFAVTAVLAANRYGLDIRNNILQGITPSIPLYVVALLVTVQLCLSSAVGNSALFQHLEDLLKIPRDFCFKRCLMRSSIVALAVFLGESVPRFDLVMGLVGSTLTGPLMFIFPPLFFIRLCYMKSTSDSLNSSQYRQINSKITSNGNGITKTFENSFNNYNTFESSNEIDVTVDEYSIKWYDLLLAIIVMFLGMVATVVTTYMSWLETINAISLSPPCLMNSTAAARLFIESSTRIV